MILHTGMRTDIPGFYSEWFANRLREGFVLVRNPYNPLSVTRYLLDPRVVDMIGFCTKNPAPMLRYMDLLRPFAQYWFVTITPYGTDIEPNVPAVPAVLESFRALSSWTGAGRIVWRYDPILLTPQWTAERHLSAFRRMARALYGATHSVVISFIKLYEKVKVNYPEVRAVPLSEQILLTQELVRIAREFDMTIKVCGDSRGLEATGADCRGCMTLQTYEEAIGQRLLVPSLPKNRSECACYLSGDIGAYNTCRHFCRYCYANTDRSSVLRNMRLHDPASPFLIGNTQPGDVIHQAKQQSWIDPQLRFF